MTGEYEHSMDSKGRVFMPARLRDELGGVFYVTVSMERCLCVYSSESWTAFSDKCSAMPFVKQRKMRPLFAMAARCEADAQGRILLPRHLLEYAGLEREALVIGAGNRAEIWNPAEYAANMQEMTAEEAEAEFAALGF